MRYACTDNSNQQVAVFCFDAFTKFSQVSVAINAAKWPG